MSENLGVHIRTGNWRLKFLTLIQRQELSCPSRKKLGTVSIRPKSSGLMPSPRLESRNFDIRPGMGRCYLELLYVASGGTLDFQAD